MDGNIREYLAGIDITSQEWKELFDDWAWSVIDREDPTPQDREKWSELIEEPSTYQGKTRRRMYAALEQKLLDTLEKQDEKNWIA